MRAIAIALLGALTLAVAGCGGANVGADTQAASLLKPGAIAYMDLVTDPESEQWTQAEQLLRKFPDGDRWIAELKRELLEQEGLDWERDVKSALGKRTIVAAYPNSGAASQGREPWVVGLTNSDDPDKTVALFNKFDQQDAKPTVTRVLDGWVAVSDSEAALDAALKADGDQSLADDQGFKDALTELPEDALGRVYVDPAAVVSMTGTAFKLLGLDELDFAGAWTKARDDGAELSFVVQGPGAETLLGTGETYSSKLLELVPADAFAFVSFRGEGLRGQIDELRGNPLLSMGLREFEREAGVNVAELAALLDGEVAFFTRPGVPTAEFTLLLESDDPAKAKRSIEPLLRFVPEPFQLTVETLENAVVVSTARSPLQASGDKLGDSDRYTKALEAANAPDEYMGLAYVDLTLAGRLVARYAGAEVNRNLEPLQTLVAYGTKDGDQASALAFIEID